MCSSPSSPFAAPCLLAEHRLTLDVRDWMTNVSKFVRWQKETAWICEWNAGLFIVGVFIFMCLMSAAAVNQCVHCTCWRHHISSDKIWQRGGNRSAWAQAKKKRSHSFWCAILSIYCHNGIVLMWWSFTQLKRGFVVDATIAFATNKRKHQNELIKVAAWHRWILSIFVHIKSRSIASNPSQTIFQLTRS